AGPAGGPAGPGPEPVLLRRADRRDPGHLGLGRVRSRDAGRLPQVLAGQGVSPVAGLGGHGRVHRGDHLHHVLQPGPGCARTEVVFLDAETQVAEAAGIAVGVPHSRLPVYQDTYDNVIGFVHVRDLLGPGVAKDSVPVRQIARPVKYLPISKTVLSSLSEMRRERAHLAIVIDEYGGTAGIVTLEDLVEEL